MKWYIRVLRKYANIGGRARRREYWMFILFHLLILLLLGAIDLTLKYADNVDYHLMSIYVVLTVLPNVAVTVRRLHDIGKSGWWILIAVVPTMLSWGLLTEPLSPFEEEISQATRTLIRIIPAIGGVWLFVLMMIDGDWDANEYGEDPKKVLKEGLEEEIAVYSNYELYKNNLVSFVIIAGVLNALLTAVYKSKVGYGSIDYLSFQTLFLVSRLVFSITPLLLSLLIQRIVLKTTLVFITIVQIVLTLHGTFGMLK